MTAYHSAAAVRRADDSESVEDSLTIEATTSVGSGGGAPAFENSWGAAHATPLGVFGPLRYYAHGGRGYIEGVTKGGTPGLSSVAFTLPVGHRPAYALLASAMSVSDAMASGTAQAAVDSAGLVTVTAAAEANVIIQADFRLA